MRQLGLSLISSLVLGVSLVGCGKDQVQTGLTFNDVQPILDAHCAECHNQGTDISGKTGFVVNSYHEVMQGTHNGPVVVSGSAVSSSLYRLVAGNVDPSIRMPLGKEPLPDSDIETIKLWIDQGARES